MDELSESLCSRSPIDIKDIQSTLKIFTCGHFIHYAYNTDATFCLKSVFYSSGSAYAIFFIAGCKRKN